MIKNFKDENNSNESKQELKELLIESLSEMKQDLMNELKNYINDSIDSKLNENKDENNKELKVSLVRGKSNDSNSKIQEHEQSLERISRNEDTNCIYKNKNLEINEEKISKLKEVISEYYLKNQKSSFTEPFIEFIFRDRLSSPCLDTLANGSYLKNKKFEDTKKYIRKKAIEIGKEHLISNPAQNYEEFIARLLEIDSNAIENGLLEQVKEHNPDNDIDFYNKFLLEYYELYQDFLDRKDYCEFLNNIKNIQDTFNIDEVVYSNYKCKNLLGEYMDRKGIKVAWLVKRTGVPRSTLESIIRNPDSMPTVDKALKISKALGEDLEVIFPLVLDEENIETE